MMFKLSLHSDIGQVESFDVYLGALFDHGLRLGLSQRLLANDGAALRQVDELALSLDHSMRLLFRLGHDMMLLDCGKL